MQGLISCQRHGIDVAAENFYIYTANSLMLLYAYPSGNIWWYIGVQVIHNSHRNFAADAHHVMHEDLRYLSERHV